MWMKIIMKVKMKVKVVNVEMKYFEMFVGFIFVI